MKKIFFLILFFLTHSLFAQQAYIKVGEAKARKSSLAFPYFNNVGSQNLGSATATAAEIYSTAKKDLELSTYFDILSLNAMLEDASKTGIKPFPEDPKGFKFESWKTIGAEFLVRGSYTVAGENLTLEVFVYQVSKSKLMFGKKYKDSGEYDFVLKKVN
jgi:TolB protein